MEERFGGKRLWMGLGALGLVFLCLMACGLLTLAALLPRPAVIVPQSGTTVGQPAASEDGAASQAQDYAHGRPAAGWFSGGGPLSFLAYGISLIFKVAFWGLLLMLLLGFFRRLFCWPRYWCRPGWDEGWQDRPHGGWRAWHPHGMHRRDKSGTTGDDYESGAPNAEYRGPQV